MSTLDLSATTFRARMRLGAVMVLPFVVLGVLEVVGLVKLALYGVAGLVGALALAVVFARPRWGVYFLVFHVYSGLNFYIPGIVPAAVLAAALVAALLELFAGEPDRLTDRMFLVSTGLFMLAVVHSMLVAYYPMLSVASSVKLLKLLAMIFLVVHYVRTRAQLRSLVLVVFLGAIATIAFGVINIKLGIYTMDNVISTRVQIYRFSGAHANPNVAAAIMCSAIPFGAFFARNASSKFRMVLALVGTLVLAVGVFATLSRSAIVSFAPVAVALVGREIRTRGGYIATAVLLALAILMTPQFYWERLRGLQTLSDAGGGRDMSVMLRYEALRTSWRLFLENPVFGIGLENFVQRGATDVIDRIVVHNTYAEVLVDTGLFGFFAYVGMLWSGLRHTLRGMVRSWKNESRAMRSLSFYVLLSGISIGVSATFGSTLFLYQLWIPVTAGLVLGRLIAAEDGVAPSTPSAA